MNFLYDSTFPYITIKQNKKKEIIKNEMSFFPNLSKVIEEIGIIKIFNDKKIICDYSNFYHVTYLMERKKGITNIKDLSIKFDFTLDVVLKAIDYMDKFFLCEKTNNIIEISSICLLISLKFNDSFSKNLNNFISHLQKSILNIIEIEQEILFTLDYDLNTFSLMDIIHIYFIKNAKSFEKLKDSPEFNRKIWFYAQAIIEDQRYLDFKILELAYCLILFSFGNNSIRFNKDKNDIQFYNFYNKLSKNNQLKFVQCKFMINIIIRSRFKKMLYC
jgi:hypothetical protein